MTRRSRTGKSSATVKKRSKPATNVAEKWPGVGGVPVQRILVADLVTFRQLRDLIDRIGKGSPNEKTRTYAAEVSENLGRMAQPLKVLQNFVPKASPGDETLSAIESAALEHINALTHTIAVACIAGVLFGFELAGDPRSEKKVREFQRAQAERAREARARISAASREEQALNAVIEHHLPRPSGRDYKDALSILDSVNKDLLSRGLPKVNVDKISRRIKKRRAL